MIAFDKKIVKCFVENEETKNPAVFSKTQGNQKNPIMILNMNMIMMMNMNMSESLARKHKLIEMYKNL